jgi:predicted DNA-binding protein (MmcQ/YjbR family)
MNTDWFRQTCLSFPQTTETVQWGHDLVFKIAGKMFAVVNLEPGDHWASFKSTPEQFVELTEREGIIPAPYLARAHWVCLESQGAMTAGELKPLLRQAYDLVVAKLPRKAQAELAGGGTKKEQKRGGRRASIG